MTGSFITTLILLGIWGLFKLWERWSRSKSDQLATRVMNIGAASYSLMVVMKPPSLEVKIGLEALMESVGYEIMGIEAKKEGFVKWNDEIYFETKQLRKGLIELGDAVVFDDPEAVMITDRRAMENFSRDYGCTVMIAIWERVSLTVIFEEYVDGQLLSSTCATAFRPDANNVNTDRELLKKADGDRLKIRLMKKGVDTRALFDSKVLNIIEYRLQDRLSSKRG